MAAKAKLTQEQIRDAIARVGRGETKRAVAAEYGVTDVSLGAAMKRYQQKRPPKPRRAPPVTLPQVRETINGDDESDELKPPAPNMSTDELRAWYSKVASDCKDEYDRLQSLNETAEARKVLDLGIKAGNALARMAKTDDDGLLRIDKADLAKRAEEVRNRLDTYLRTGRPLLCDHCGRALSVSWGDEA